MKRIWKVWTEKQACSNIPIKDIPEDNETVLIEGGEIKCRKYYKQNGGSKAGLHIGYEVKEWNGADRG